MIWPMFVGPYIALSNPSFFLETESSLNSGLYIARNLAVGIAFLVAIYLKNASMLFILIIVRLITDLIDAESDLLDVNVTYLNAKKDYILNYFKIKALEGNLLELFKNYIPKIN